LFSFILFLLLQLSFYSPSPPVLLSPILCVQASSWPGVADYKDMQSLRKWILMASSTSSCVSSSITTETWDLTSVCMEVSGQLHALAASSLEKDPSVLIVLEAAWAPQPD
jgi:hypothetical protein